MNFSFVGAAVGLSLARRNNLPAGTAGTVAIAAGAFGTTPLGLALAVALAQRYTPPPLPPVIPVASTRPAAAAAQPPAGVAAQPAAGGQVQAAIARAAAQLQQVAHQFPGPQHPLATPGKIEIRAARQGQKYIVSVTWDPVDGARHYYVKTYRRKKSTDPWDELPKESMFVDGHRKVDLVLPSGETEADIRETYGFTVSAAAESPLSFGHESEKTQAVL